MAEATGYRTALVTGASRGIGAAIVAALRQRGLEVHAAARSSDALQALAQRTGCRPLALDLTDTAALERALAGLEVDVLVNNAGIITAWRPLAEMTREDVDGMVDVNLRSMLHVLRVLLPGMIARDRGHVFNISSIAALYPFPASSVYGATKAAVRSLTNTLRIDLAGRRIRVTEIAPGRVETDIYVDAFGGDRRVTHDKLYARVEASQPEDVAAVLLAALDSPARTDVTFIEVMPTAQTVGGGRIVETR